MKLGLLYPRSQAHPNIDIDFVDGVKTCLKEKGLTNEVQISMESVGFGGAEKEVYEKVEKLIRFDQVDMIVGFVDMKVLPLLEPLLFSSGKLMIVVNPGANYPQNWVPQPNIVHLTLQHAFLNWMTGGLAAEKEQAKGAFVTTFFDCGYLHTAAITKHFMKKGGTPVFNYVNRDKYDDSFHIQPLLDFLAANKETDRLLCTFDALPASLLYNRLNNLPDADALQLFVSPMMLEKEGLKELNNGFRFSVDGFLPWHPSLQHEANSHFQSYFEEHAKRPVSIFSLLGWEAGLIVEEIRSKNKGSYDAETIIASLAGEPVISPRGTLKLDAATNYFTAPAIRCHIEKGATSMSMKWLKHLENEWAAFSETEPESVSSGWTNTYLCY